MRPRRTGPIILDTDLGGHEAAGRPAAYFLVYCRYEFSRRDRQ